MDAVKFLWERARMCGHGCENCPTSDDKCDIYTPDCDYESLVKAVNQALAELREEGKLSEAAIKYFGSDISQDPQSN